MKKIFFAFVMLALLSSCGNSQEKIDAAKQTLLEQEIQQTASGETNISTATGEELPENSEILKEGIEIIEYGQTPVLKFNTLKIEDFLDGEAEISGETLSLVDSIEVSFSNADSDFPQDNYTLQTFKSGDTSFKYIASSGFKVLDFGENIYTFRAYSGDKISETKIIIRLKDPQKNEDLETQTGSESQLIGTEDNTLLLNLPTSSKYGEPVRLGESSFTYSSIKGFEVEKKIIPSVTCEVLSDYLKENMKSWYYWNTCRDIIKEKGISFNVIRLDGDQYIYERHYIDFSQGLYGTYELERGTGVTKDTIGEKNDELKDKEFPNTEIVDDLMKDIIRS